MTAVAIVQARMRSTRLSGKSLQDIGGVSMLGRVVRRLRRSRRLAEVVVATTVRDIDQPIVEEAKGLGAPACRGSEEDVLDRYRQAAREHPADVVVRVTSDCPLIDPTLVDRVVEALAEEDADYAANVVQRSFPRGLDVEAITAAVLERVWRSAVEPHHRAHVTLYVHDHPAAFRIASVVHDKDLSHHRWTVDEPDDLAFVRAVYGALGNRDDFAWTDVLDVLAREPALTAINAHVRQKAHRDG
jgi:spore coat polysaccharide biosynthesis protein SpsF